MTWLFLQVLWLLSTWLMYPNYMQPLPIVDYIMTQQEIETQLLIEEQQQKHEAEQQRIAIEDYFLFADKIGNIKYARWCAWGYEKSSRSTTKNKRVKCNKKAFDCWWAMKAYLVAKWILTKESISYFNSNTLYDLWIKKDPRTAQRWDFMYRRWFWRAATGNTSTHFAVVSRDYTGGRTMWIYDNVVPNGTDRFHEREIPITCNKTMCHYAGIYRIYISTNGVLELLKTTGKEITPREDIEQTWEVLMSIPPITKTLSGTATWYDYELDWQERSKSHDTCALRETDRYWTYRVTNTANGKTVDCYHNDYWPKEYTNKIIDLSSHAFKQIADLKSWVANVTIERIK